jgi:uncharacterized membrane protein YgdD (TMEM256/DUF423 family)
MAGHRLVVVAAILGLLAVAAGAFGAHALSGDPRASALVETASRYQLWHALALLLVVALKLPVRRPAAAWLAGIALFSGSLYALALGAPRSLAILAPVGGALLMLGWALLALSAWRARSSGASLP